jgi:hypothetical protein
MKVTFIFIFIFLLILLWPRNSTSPYISTCCDTNFDKDYINRFAISTSTTNSHVFVINIPYNEINSSIITNFNNGNKWNSIIRGGIAHAFKSLPGFSYISPMNILIEIIQPAAYNFIKIYFYFVDVFYDQDLTNQRSVSAFNSLFLPNSRTNPVNVFEIITSGEDVPNTQGCPSTGCMSETIGSNVICTPNVGCRDNGILSDAISMYMNGSSGTRQCICYYNEAPAGL